MVVVDANRTMVDRMRHDLDQYARQVAETYAVYGGDTQEMLNAYFAGMAPLNLDDAGAAWLKDQVKQGISLQMADEWPTVLAPGQFAIMAFQTTNSEYSLQLDMPSCDRPRARCRHGRSPQGRPTMSKRVSEREAGLGQTCGSNPKTAR